MSLIFDKSSPPPPCYFEIINPSYKVPHLLGALSLKRRQRPPLGLKYCSLNLIKCGVNSFCEGKTLIIYVHFASFYTK